MRGKRTEVLTGCMYGRMDKWIDGAAIHNKLFTYSNEYVIIRVYTYQQRTRMRRQLPVRTLLKWIAAVVRCSSYAFVCLLTYCSRSFTHSCTFAHSLSCSVHSYSRTLARSYPSLWRMLSLFHSSPLESTQFAERVFVCVYITATA